jgi:ribosomal protein S18 acetylase RimI-like enzyme
MDLEYRPMILSDADIQRLRAAAGKARAFAADVLSGRVIFRECIHDGRVVGHCIGNSSTGEIIGLSVDHRYRRRGIARKLLTLVVDLMRADDALRIWLSVPRDTTLPAHHFYRALGWRQTGEEPSTGDVILEV